MATGSKLWEFRAEPEPFALPAAAPTRIEMGTGTPRVSVPAVKIELAGPDIPALPAASGHACSPRSSTLPPITAFDSHNSEIDVNAQILPPDSDDEPRDSHIIWQNSGITSRVLAGQFHTKSSLYNVSNMWRTIKRVLTKRSGRAVKDEEDEVHSATQKLEHPAACRAQDNSLTPK
ncbi:hypothetical protein DFH07DRAFT_771590 [Mycena maculata]|uniref:Uncharacterized protein n=1 Tax=Mycena maculata TaxID=230809 RepID=A0AAD7JDR7_9AGAR|nr:hypothetical protein DFH07DRAFT_771590 [Mycena maculata]